jgi:hypothetical protein
VAHLATVLDVASAFVQLDATITGRRVEIVRRDAVSGSSAEVT